MRCIIDLIAVFALIFFSQFVLASANHANVLSLSAAGTNITTSAYVQLSAASPVPTSKLVISNTTAQILVIATGASGSEVDLVAVVATTGLVNLNLGHTLPAGIRIAVEAIGSTASTGYVTVSLLP